MIKDSTQVSSTQATSTVPEHVASVLATLDFSQVTLPEGLNSSADLAKLGDVLGDLAVECLTGSLDMNKLEHIRNVAKLGPGMARLMSEPYHMSFTVNVPPEHQSKTDALREKLSHTSYFGAQTAVDGTGGSFTVHLGANRAGGPAMVGAMDIADELRASFAEAGAEIGELKSDATLGHIDLTAKRWKADVSAEELKALAKDHGIEATQAGGHIGSKGKIRIWYADSDPSKVEAFESAVLQKVSDEDWSLNKHSKIDKTASGR